MNRSFQLRASWMQRSGPGFSAIPSVGRSKGVRRNARLWEVALGSKPMRQITPGDIQPYASRRLAEEVPKPSVNRELTFLRAVFYMAKGDEKNPHQSRAGKGRRGAPLADG